MEKVGLVFAGGGGKGAYHIGVWKALREYGVENNVQAIAGTSVGALNAVLFLQGNYEIAEHIWLTLSQDKILTVDASRIVNKLTTLNPSGPFINLLSNKIKRTSQHGIFSRAGLLEIIDEYVNLNIVSRSEKPCYAACCEIPSFTAKYFKLNGCSNERIKKIILASSALPFIFDDEKIDGKTYIDGGIRDNLPVQALYDEGCRIIIAVHLGRNHVINNSGFDDLKLFEIIPQDYQGGFFTGTLDFTPEGAMRRIQQGYDDTVEILKPIFEMGMVQLKINKSLNLMHEQEMYFADQRTEILKDRNKLKEEIDDILAR